MKKQLLLTSLIATVAASSFAQGTVSFKTSITKNPVFYSPDDGATLSLVPTTGDFGMGTVNYVIFSAPNGTPVPYSGDGYMFVQNLLNSSAWTSVAVPNPAYSTAGVVSPGITVTLGSGSGAGNNAEVEIVAYVGSSLSNPTMLAWSGELYNGSGSFTYNGTTYSTGAARWSQATGNPAPPTPTVPGTLTTGPNGFGSLVFYVPEPSTFTLCGLGAAALLLFRRRKS